MAEDKSFVKDGVIKTYTCENGYVLATVEIGGMWISNPTIAQMEADGWREYIAPAPRPYEPTREEKIHTAIRERYTDNSEYMILRHHAADPVKYADEFREYNEFVESVLAQYPEEL